MSITDWPCDECKAEAGEPCADDCPLRDMAEVEMDLDYVSQPVEEYDAWESAGEVTGTPPIDESAGLLMSAVYRLPYGALVGSRGEGPPDRQDYTHEEWLAALADWMVEYEAVCRAMVDELQSQARQRISLQLEKDVMQRWMREAVA